MTTAWSELDVRSKANWARKLSDNGYDVTLLTPNAQGTAIAREYVNDIIQLQLPDQPSISAKKLEEQWKIPSVPHLYKTEQEYFALDEPQTRNRTVRIATAVEKIFENHDFDVIYQGRGSEIHRLLIYYAAKHHDAATIWGEFSPFNNSIAFGTGLDGTWANYRTIPYEEMSADGCEETRSFVEEFKQQQKFYDHGSDDSGGILLKELISTSKRVYDRFTSDQPRNTTGMMERQIRKSVNARINEQLLPSPEESRQLATRNEYVYFPLQYPIESRLTLFSPQCYNQQSIIKYISRILPADVRLLVKQHPNHPGHQSPLWIRSVDQLSNVDVVAPSVNSHKLIQSAAAVVVTNNTVGFEALFYEAPLVVLGAAFYMDTPAARRVQDYGLLPRALSDAIRTETTEEEIVSSIYSLQQTVFSAAGEVGSEKRATDVANSISEFIETEYGDLERRPAD